MHVGAKGNKPPVIQRTHKNETVKCSRKGVFIKDIKVASAQQQMQKPTLHKDAEATMRSRERPTAANAKTAKKDEEATTKYPRSPISNQHQATAAPEEIDCDSMLSSCLIIDQSNPSAAYTGEVTMKYPSGSKHSQMS